MKLKIKKIHPDAKIPQYAHIGDAGFDVYVPEKVIVMPGERKTIPLGLALEIPEGHAGLLLDKSGLSHKHGIQSFGGIIDSGYRGEFHAGIMNMSDKPYTFEKGDKIIQMLIMPVTTVEIEEATELSPSNRGDGRFGSTGKK